MASTITRTKTIRMRNETADWLDKLDARAVIESCHDLVESGGLVLEGCFLKISENKKGCPFNWQIVAAACDDEGVDYDEAARRFAQYVYRGMV